MITLFWIVVAYAGIGVVVAIAVISSMDSEMPKSEGRLERAFYGTLRFVGTALLWPIFAWMILVMSSRDH